MNYTEACRRAKKQSIDDACTKHVCARIVIPRDGPPVIDQDGYYTSDWRDGTVVATFTSGEEHDR